MSKWGLAIVCVCMILGGCANNNAVVVQPRPPSRRPVNWGWGSLTVPASAMQPEPCKQQSAAQVANQPGYRQLTVSLESGSDAPAKLSPGDLKIRDGSQGIAVQFLQQEAASVGILVDTSGSMEPKMRQVEVTLTDLIDRLNPNDQAFLMAFSSRPFVLQAFTSDHAELKQRLALVRAFGQTSLRDTIIQGLLMVRHGCNQNKALFVMTDGMDNTSSVKPSEMIAAVKESKVPIFALGIGNEAPPSLYTRLLTSGDQDRVDATTLRELAKASSGKAYILPDLGDAQAKQTALAIASGIDSRYAVGFVSAANSKIRIQLMNHPGATLKIEGGPPDVSVVNNSRP